MQATGADAHATDRREMPTGFNGADGRGLQSGSRVVGTTPSLWFFCTVTSATAGKD